MPARPTLRRTATGLTLAAMAAPVLLAAGPAAAFVKHNLVSDGFVPADHTDPNLVNPWGVVFNPTGFVWVANNHTGTSTLYDGNGVPQSLVVTVPGSAAPPTAPPNVGSPTGVVFSGSASDFTVTSGAASGPARFIFAGEDGTISGWAPGVPPPAPSTRAQRVVDNSASGSVYKGLATATAATGARLYATDFHNNTVHVFNASFAPLPLAGAFTDPGIPAGFAPFGIQAAGSTLFVSYAKQDAQGQDDDPGAGRGYVDAFDTDGNFLRRVASAGALNSPWGMAIAPAGFGSLGGKLLVGNFGDGTINAFDPLTGAPAGTLNDAAGNPISIEGLWGFSFGNNVQSQPADTLFFTAGPGGEDHGLYGRIDVVPGPGTLGLLLAGLPLAGRRRR